MLIFISPAMTLLAQSPEARTEPHDQTIKPDGNNLLSNPDFQLGLTGWDTFTLLGVGGGFELTNSTIDGTPINALLVKLPDRETNPLATMNVRSDWITVPDQAIATFSIYARAESGTPTMEMIMVDSGVSRKTQLDNQWRRYSLSGTLKLSDSGVEAVAVRLSGSGEAQLARAQFETGNATAYQPNPAPRIGLAVDDGVGLLHPGESARLSLKATGDLEASDRIQVAWGRYGKPGEILADLSAQEVAENGWTWRMDATDAYGLYRFNVTLLRNGKEIDQIYHTLGVVPVPASSVPGHWDEFALSITMRDVPEQAEKARRMGASIVRMHGFGLSLLQRYRILAATEGTQAWPTDTIVQAVYDKGLSQFPYLVDHHGDLVRSILSSPQAKDDLAKFAKQMAAHYQGRIQAYQLWNEPEFKISPEDYAQIHDLLVPAFRAGDPEAFIVGFGSVHPWRQFLQHSVEAGATTDVNAVAFHFYLNGHPPERMLPRKMALLLGENQSILEACALDGVEIWDTESGFLANEDAYPRPDTTAAPPFFYKEPSLQAAYNVRQYLVGMELGIDLRSAFMVDSLSPYFGWLPHGMFRPDSFQGPRPAAVAYAQMTHHLRGQTFTGLWQDKDGNRFVAAFDGPDGQTLVAYTLFGDNEFPIGKSRPTDVGGMLGEALDSSGNSVPIGPEPIYLKWPSGQAPIPGQEPALSDWTSFDPSRIGITDERAESAPPIDLDYFIEAETSEFFRWSPGAVTAEGSSGGQVLMIQGPQRFSADALDVSYRIDCTSRQAGKQEFWISCGSLFGHVFSDLEVRVNNSPWTPVRGTDQPADYEIRIDGEAPVTIGWERLGIFELREGTNMLTLRLVPKADSDTPTQIFDRLGWRPIQKTSDNPR
jgi:hypothetical protein